jgi:hypothetical protein
VDVYVSRSSERVDVLARTCDVVVVETQEVDGGDEVNGAAGVGDVE